jgi:sensor histidine kinase regulating citrate/malate metabolism
MTRIFPFWPTLMLVLSAVGFFVLLAVAVPEALVRSAKYSAQASNEDKVSLFMRLVYPSIAADLKLSPSEGSVPLHEDAAFTRVDQKIREFAAGTHIVKVKIFDSTGQVVYSSNPAQLGERFTEGTEAILHASRGRAFSDVTFRDKFLGYSGQLSNVAIVSSYLPVRDEQRNIVGIAEIYSERTEVFQEITYDKAKILSMLVIGFALLGAMCTWVLWSMYLRTRETIEDQAQA